jgi:hypothetical protein
MSDDRIVVRLDERIPFERKFADAYKKIPRSRRQEWLRALLKVGFESMGDYFDGTQERSSSSKKNIPLKPN